MFTKPVHLDKCPDCECEYGLRFRFDHRENVLYDYYCPICDNVIKVGKRYYGEIKSAI